MTHRCAGGTSKKTEILQSTIMKPMLLLLPIKYSVAIQKISTFFLKKKKTYLTNFVMT